MQVNKISRNKMSNYMLSIMDPRFPAPIPDVQDFTTAIVKQVTLAKDLAVAGSGTLAFIVSDHTVPARVLVLAYGRAAQVWSPLTTINYSENMSDNYAKARVTSGLTKVVSATVTGNAFTVSGSAVAISYQDLPPFFAQGAGGINIPGLVEFGTLQSYARNPTCRQGLTRVADGVIALVHPEGQNEYYDVNDQGYVALEKNPVGVTDLSRAYSSTTDSDAGASSGFVSGGTVLAGVNQQIFSSLSCTGTGARYVPPNAMGKVRYSGALTFYNPANAGDMTIQLQAVLVRADPTTYEPIFSGFVMSTAVQYIPVGGQTTVNLSGTVDFRADSQGLFYFIQSFRLLATGPAGGGVVFGSGSLTIDYLSLGETFFESPGTVIAVEGVSVGQVLAVSGILNYQAVPNANLARQIASDLTYVKNMDELILAHSLVSNAALLGLRFLYTIPEYEMLVNDFPKLAEMDNMRAISAGLFDGLRGFWRNWLAPTLKANLGTVLGSIGSSIRPDLGALGATIGTGVASLIPDYSGQAKGLGRGIGMCMGLYVAPWDMDDPCFVACLEGIVGEQKIAIHQVARLLCYNHRTQAFEHPRLEATVDRIIQLGKAGMVAIVTVQGSHFVGRKHELDLPSELLAWARTRTAFTQPEVRKQFGEAAITTFETMLRAKVFEKVGETYQLANTSY
jgi:hypothetical protein